MEGVKIFLSCRLVVLREDFEVQQKLLERAQAKLAELETRIAELESKRDKA